MAKKTATFVCNVAGMRGDARLYELSEPHEGYGVDPTSRVIVSAVVAPLTGPETYIFAAGDDGRVSDWGEMPGSFQGALDHEQALRGAGYEVAP